MPPNVLKLATVLGAPYKRESIGLLSAYYGPDSAEKTPSWMEFDIFDIAYRNAQRRA